MAINVKFKSDSFISLELPAGLESGDPFVVGDLVGITSTGTGQGVGNAPTYGSVILEGGVDLPITAGETWNVGTTIYIKTADNTLTTTAGSNKRFGKVTHINTHPNGDKFAIVKIVQ